MCTLWQESKGVLPIHSSADSVHSSVRGMVGSSRKPVSFYRPDRGQRGRSDVSETQIQNFHRQMVIIVNFQSEC